MEGEVWLQHEDHCVLFDVEGGRLDVKQIAKTWNLDPASLIIASREVRTDDNRLSARSIDDFRGVEEGRDGRSKEKALTVVGQPSTTGSSRTCPAHSLALLEPGDGGQGVNLAGGPFVSGHLDMSYESLVLLENVKCTAPPTLVNRLTRHVFKAKSLSTDCEEELCTICQVEYKDKDSYMLLPCLHTFHDICGSEWFLYHSKLCPVCKHDMTEKV